MDLALVELLDELAARAVPPEETHEISGWVARRSLGRAMRRGNSVWPRRRHEDDIAEAVAGCESFYSNAGLATRFQISPASQPSELTDFLLACGYQAHNLTATYICDLEHVQPKAQLRTLHSEITAVPTDAWWSMWTTTSSDHGRYRSGTAVMFDEIATDTGFAHVELDGEPAGIGMSVLSGDWFGIFNIETAAHLRQRGVGRLVVDSLMLWAQGHGAQFGYVQVEVLNVPALALYAHAGYLTHAYDYQYLSKDPAAG